LLASLALGSAWAVGCDSAPGIPEGAADPPVVSGLTISESRLVLADGLSEQTFRVAISATVESSRGEPEVNFVIRKPFSGGVLTEGTLSRTGGDTFEATADLTLRRGESGPYAVVVTATDASRRLSAPAQAIIQYVAPSLGPPEIVALEAPGHVNVPTQLRMVAVVQDPDGAHNVSRVVVTTEDGFPYDLSDDGRTFGDQTAGDGRFTISFSLPANFPAGVLRFTFVAIDREGLRSDPLVHQVEIRR
jgi:hypothetical protein